MLIDLHVHPSLKAYRQKKSLWENIKFDRNTYKQLTSVLKNEVKEIVVDSQSNFQKIHDTKVKCSVVSLVAVEKQYFDVNEKNLLVNLIVPKNDRNALAQCLLGITKKQAQQELDLVDNPQLPVNYFDELLEQYNFLINPTYNSKGSVEMVVVKDYNHYLEVKDDPNKVRVLMSIEGGNSLLNYPSYKSLLKEKLSKVNLKNLKKQVSINIKTIKNWGGGDHCPFFITLCHFFWNHMAGHPKSLGVQKLSIVDNSNVQVGLIPGMENLLDQNVGMNLGITELGWHVIEELLSAQNGKRILIDIKHLSINARREYFAYVRARADLGDFIPIFCSHAAVNGVERFDDFENFPDDGETDANERFSRWSINLYDEDIMTIYNTDGIIGLMLHEKRMPGTPPIKRIKKYKKRNQIKKLKQEYLNLLMGNIFHIIYVIGTERAWDILSIGSDLDGLVDAFDCYDDINEYINLKEDMLDYLKNLPSSTIIYVDNRQYPISKLEMQNLMFGLSPKEIVDKITYKNAESFFRHFFNDAYRTKEHHLELMQA